MSGSGGRAQYACAIIFDVLDQGFPEIRSSRARLRLESHLKESPLGDEHVEWQQRAYTKG